MFKEINIRELNESPVKMISDDMALLTAGSTDDWNTMTVSWGGIGELWGKDVVFCFVRPQRYTYEFMEKQDVFTMSFFGGQYKKELGFCGSKSGRDVDKAKETGLVPAKAGEGVTFEQAQTVIVLKKIAFQDIDPKGFLSDDIMGCYKDNDYHRVYIGEIEKVLVKE